MKVTNRVASLMDEYLAQMARVLVAEAKQNALPDTREIPAYTLRPGHIIVEPKHGGKPTRTHVMAAVRANGACKGIHVNDRWCYEYYATVTVAGRE